MSPCRLLLTFCAALWLLPGLTDGGRAVRGWDAMLDQFIAFRQQTGLIDIPEGRGDGGGGGEAAMADWGWGRLHTWLRRQRRRSERGALHDCRRRLLEAAGMPLAFARSRRGGIRREAPAGYGFRMSSARPSAGEAAATSPRGSKGGERAPHGSCVSSAVAGVPVKGKFVAKWTRWLELLRDYRSTHGHSRVPKMHTVGGRQLGQWVSRQRKLIKAGGMPSERKKALSAAGLGREGSVVAHWGRAWFKSYGIMCLYAQSFGNVTVPRRLVYGEAEGGEVAFGEWVHRQRERLRAAKIQPERRRLFESISVPFIERDSVEHGEGGGSGRQPEVRLVKRHSKGHFLAAVGEAEQGGGNKYALADGASGSKGGLLAVVEESPSAAQAGSLPSFAGRRDFPLQGRDLGMAGESPSAAERGVFPHPEGRRDFMAVAEESPSVSRRKRNTVLVAGGGKQERWGGKGVVMEGWGGKGVVMEGWSLPADERVQWGGKGAVKDVRGGKWGLISARLAVDAEDGEGGGLEGIGLMGNGAKLPPSA